MTGVTPGFIPEPLSVLVSNILPSRRIPTPVVESRKFKQIRTSIEAVGLIEPLSVTPADQSSGQHVLLDGMARVHSRSRSVRTCMPFRRAAIFVFVERLVDKPDID